MKIMLLAGITALPFLLASPHRSEAVIFECANCSQWAEQLISDGRQASQLAMQAEQKALQLQQYQNMLQNTMQLPRSVWANVTNDINAVRNLANASSLLTGNSGSILSRLQSAQGYANQALYTPQNVSQQFAMWQQTLGQSSNALGRTLGLQQGQEANYALQQAQIQAMPVTGQLQALQQSNQLAALTSSQLNQLQVTLTAAAQQQATHDIVGDDRRAAEDEAMQRLLRSQPVRLDGYRGY